MPWLTPDTIPEGDDCRPLLIPASSAWLALVSGALTELTKPYNWQKFGTLTVQETVDEMQAIVDYYYSAPCATCVTPGGYRVTRISSTGHLQQLNSDGSWEDATDDYAIPSPTARTEGTAPDQNCLAAKNATNVLSQLYESLSESFSSELSTDEAITAFIAAAVAAIGFEFAPITWSIAAIGFVFFEALFKALEYITADLWTEAFSHQFECMLLECVVNTDGVVTFDWDCFNAGLEAQVNDNGLSETQMRLYVQVGYILFFIGGADALNLAARTTDITNDDCSFCGEWCYHFDFKTSMSGVTVNRGTFVPSSGLQVAFEGGDQQNTLAWVTVTTPTIPDGTLITSAEMLTSVSSVGADAVAIAQANDRTVTFFDVGLLTGDQTWFTSPLTINYTNFSFLCVVSQDPEGGGDGYMTGVTFRGTGENPFGANNC